MHSGKLNSTELNWTELNWIVQLSAVQFSAVHWTGDDLRRRRASPVFVQRQTSRWLTDSQVSPDCEEPAMTADFVAKYWHVVAGSIHSRKLNWTEQFSWVELSWVQFPAVRWALDRIDEILIYILHLWWWRCTWNSRLTTVRMLVCD